MYQLNLAVLRGKEINKQLRVFMQIWQMLAAVLHMSNLEYDKVDHEQGDIAFISDREVSILLYLVCNE